MTGNCTHKTLPKEITPLIRGFHMGVKKKIFCQTKLLTFVLDMMETLLLFAMMWWPLKLLVIGHWGGVIQSNRDEIA